MGKKRKPAPRNYIGSSKVVIKKHVIDRYMERVGVSFEEARDTLVYKFKNSRLSHLKPDGSEVRSEINRAMNKRLTFIAKKEGNTFIVITCYLQGPKDNWWKNEGLKIEQPVDFEIIKQEITEEIATKFQEVIG